MKTAILLITICVCAGCVTSPKENVDRGLIVKKQTTISMLQEEIMNLLIELESVQKELADQSKHVKSHPQCEYSAESQCRDLDVTIKILEECQRRLADQLKGLRRSHNIPVIN